MIKLIPLLFISFIGFSQSFAPAPGVAGSTAIHKDSSSIIFWADDAIVTRGPLNIQNVSLGDASYGVESDAEGAADGLSFVSLGDGGEVVVSFPYVISDGPGPDFCVFENGFIDHYMELAFVEVSSDGVNFFRFNAVSEIPTDVQLSNFNTSNCGYVNNLAGKYRVNYGTPFDLNELDGLIGLDINHITHVKLIDVIGIIDPTFASLDSQGTIINDPYPTEWESGGFDLDGIGVMNSPFLELSETSFQYNIYPNPFKNQLKLEASGRHEYQLIDLTGRLIDGGFFDDQLLLHTHGLAEGNYLIKLDSGESKMLHKL